MTGENVEIVKRFKYLGVRLDQKLNFGEHTTYLCNEIRRKLKTLNCIRCYIGMNTVLYLYNSLIAPLFTCNEHIYDAVGTRDANKLQVTQNNCIRACLKCHNRTHRIELHQQSGIIPLYIQRQIHTVDVVHRGLNKSSTSYINNMFNLTGNGRGVTTWSEIR